MSDLEKRLAAFLREDAKDVTTSGRMSGEVVRRVRRRQALTGMVAGLVTLALVVGSLAVARTLLPLAERRDAPGTGIDSPGDTGMRTAYLPHSAIDYPEGWWVTDLAGVPRRPYNETTVLDPLLQVTNFTPDLELHDFDNFEDEQSTQPTLHFGACEDMPTGGAAMGIGRGYFHGWPDDVQASWPPAFEVHGGGPTPERPCRDELQAKWTTPEGDRYWAWAAIAPGGPDPSVLQSMLDSLRYPDTYPAVNWRMFDGPSLWIGGGADEAGRAWDLTVGAPEGKEPLLALSDDWEGPLHPEPATGVGGPAGFGAIRRVSLGTVYGTVSQEADTIEMVGPDGSTTGGRLFPLPDSPWGPAHAFVVRGSSVVPGQLVARDAAGNIVAEADVTFDPGPVSDREAQASLRNALAAAKSFFTDGDTYQGATPDELSWIESTLAFDESPTARPGVVSIRAVSPTTILLVTRSDTGVFCLADDAQTWTFYGSVDARSMDQCTEDEWPAPATASPAL